MAPQKKSQPTKESDCFGKRTEGFVKAISIAKFVAIILLVVTLGVYGLLGLLTLADTYDAVSDPCGTCEKITSLKCEPEYTNFNIITIEETEGGEIEWKNISTN